MDFQQQIQNSISNDDREPNFSAAENLSKLTTQNCVASWLPSLYAGGLTVYQCFEIIEKSEH
jgi:hypothetical protein